MNRTKRQILDNALELFNSLGYAQVSLREIAEMSGISPGNLTYHFKKREDLVEALYFEFIDETNQTMGRAESEQINVELLFELVKNMMQIRMKYQFLTHDMSSIAAEKTNIKIHYAQVLVHRKTGVLAIIRKLQDAQLLRASELEHEYENLYERIEILSTYWLSSLLLKDLALNQEVLSSYFQAMIQAIYPYLTIKGKTQWNEAIKNY